MTRPPPDTVRSLVERSCAAQNVPIKISDAMVIARIAQLLGFPTTATPAAPGQGPNSAPRTFPERQ